MMRNLAILLMCSVICGCATDVPPTSAGSYLTPAQDDRLLIEAVSDRWKKAFEDGDADALASLFTEDAIYAANTGELLRGRNEVRTAAERWTEHLVPIRKKANVRLQEQVLRREQHGYLTYVVSRFTMTVNPPGCLINAGYSLGVLERQADGQWLIDALTVNRDRDPLENACPR